MGGGRSHAGFSRAGRYADGGDADRIVQVEHGVVLRAPQNAVQGRSQVAGSLPSILIPTITARTSHAKTRFAGPWRLPSAVFGGSREDDRHETTAPIRRPGALCSEALAGAVIAKCLEVGRRPRSTPSIPDLDTGSVPDDLLAEVRFLLGIVRNGPAFTATSSEARSTGC